MITKVVEDINPRIILQLTCSRKKITVATSKLDFQKNKNKINLLY